MLSRAPLLVLAVLVPLAASGSAAAQSAFSGSAAVPRVMRISVENRESHVQVRMLKLFVERVKDSTAGAVSVELHSGARLFRDADVVSALAMGKIEMAVPGIWQLDRFSPDFAALMLPSAYGLPETDLARAVDGPFGLFLSRSLQDALPVHVLGRWMELGSAHAFFVGKNVKDFRGLRVRVPGGAANEERVRVFGAFPVSIPWPDLPSFMARGGVDAVVSSYETILSAGLQEKGIGAVLEESQDVGYYVPILSRRFWEGLDDASRSAIAEAWEATADQAREEARAAQAHARNELRSAGVRVVAAPAAERLARRDALLAAEAEIAARVHASSEAIGLLRRSLGAGAR